MIGAGPGRGMFWTLVLGGWVSLLALGGTWIYRHPRPVAAVTEPASGGGCRPDAAKRQMPGFAATRPLAPNHLIRQEDLNWAGQGGGAQPSDMLWRYSRCAIAAGHRVVAAETAALPTIAVPDGRVSHAFPLDGNPRAASAINAGTVLDIFAGGHVVARGVSVLALDCRSGSPDACVAILDVAADDVPRLTAADGKTALLVMTAKP